MQAQALTTTARAISLIAIAVTIFVGIYMAQPWGDNYAYQNPSDYLVLVMFLFWAITPYLYLFRLGRHMAVSTPMLVFSLMSVFVVSIGGVYLIVDTAFFNIDAQGGLIFLFLPVYQWFLIGVFYGVARLWGAVVAS